MREKKESAVKRNRTLITGSARVPPMWREYKQGFHPCGKSTVHLSERTGSWREGTLVPGSLPWAKARFFRGYDGVFKPSSFTVFCAPTREGAVIKARIYYGLWSPVVCTALLQSIKKKKKKKTCPRLFGLCIDGDAARGRCPREDMYQCCSWIEHNVIKSKRRILIGPW